MIATGASSKDDEDKEGLLSKIPFNTNWSCINTKVNNYKNDVYLR